MKVLVYRPNDGFLCEENGTSAPTYYRTFSYSLATCAASIADTGARVTVLDAGAEGLSFQEAIARIERIRPDVLVIALNNFAAYLGLMGVTDLKKRLDLPVIALLTHSMEEETIRAHPAIDVAIRREWGAASSDVIEAFSANRDLTTVPGVFFKNNDKISKTQPRPHQALDDRPLPALSLFPMTLYDAYQIPMSEGCNYHCSFCWFNVYPPSGWAGRNIDRIIEELKMFKFYGNRPVFTIDDELTLDPEYAKRLCRKIINARLYMMFSATTRADRADDELFALMSQAGFFNLQFGIESGCQDILNKNGTKKNLDQAIKVFSMLEKRKISTKVFFLIGLLYETKETITQTFNFITKDLKHYDASFDIAIPYPETGMYKYLRKKGWVESLNTKHLSWIYYHVYGCRQLSGVPMEKPFWRIGDLTFNDLFEIERKYYHRVPHGGRTAQLRRLAFNPHFRKTLAHFTVENPIFMAQMAYRAVR